MSDEHAAVLVTTENPVVVAMKSESHNLCVRYFTSVTPKDEGSIVFTRVAGDRVTGTQLAQVFHDKGVPLENHHPQAYVNSVGGYCNLDDDLVFPLQGEGENALRVDVRFTPLAGPQGAREEEPSVVAKASTAPILANPGPMALFAFAFTTCLLMLIEVEAVSSTSLNLVIGFAMCHGGEPPLCGPVTCTNSA